MGSRCRGRVGWRLGVVSDRPMGLREVNDGFTDVREMMEEEVGVSGGRSANG